MTAQWEADWPLPDSSTVIERGQNFVAASDAWNFDSYLARVIIIGLSLLEEGPAQQNSNEFEEMIYFFVDYICEDRGINAFKDEVERVLYERRKQRAFRLLGQNFEGLWD